MSIATETEIRLGVIASSGGSVFEALLEISAGVDRFVWSVVSDRPCGIEQIAAHNGISCVRIVEKSNATFSMRAADVFSANKIDSIFLFFLRLVTAEIYDNFLCLNFHPSLLPEFPGFHAVERARGSGQRTLGATLHIVTADADGGSIVAQTSDDVQPDWLLSQWQNMSYAQKVRLGTWALDEMLSGSLTKAAFANKGSVLFTADWVPRHPALALSFDAWREKMSR